MDQGGPSPVQEEVLVPQLAWQLKNVSSLVQGSRAVTVHAQPGTYDPLTSRLVKIHLADSSSWAELGSLKFCFELVNKSQTAPLEFLGNPLIAFDQYRLLSQGTVLSQIDFYGRAINTLASTLPLEARVKNGDETLPMKHGLLYKSIPNADGKFRALDTDGIENGGAFDGAANQIPRDSSIECERFISIPPGQKRTVCCTPLCGIVNSQMMWPLAHASLVFEWTLCSDPESVVASSTVANAAAGGAPGNAPIARSHEWEIQLPRLELNLVQLSSVGDAEFNSLLAGEGLHMDISQTVHLQTAITNKDPRISFYRSLANMKQVFVTTYMDPFVASTLTAAEADNIYLTQWAKAFLKEVNFLFPGRNWILKKTVAAKRGAINAATGVPADTGARTLAQSIADDKALTDNPTTFQLMIGAKKYPEQDIKQGELVMHEKQALGTSSYRSGFGQSESQDLTKKIFAMNLEKISADLDGAGASSRSGESIQVIFKDLGTDRLFPVRAYMLIQYTQKIEVRTGVVRTLD